jgi:hypothetical protein
MIEVRPAEPGDNKQLVDFLLREAFPGRISFSFDYSPNFFDALSTRGESHQVVLATEEKTIIGVAVCSIKTFLVSSEEIRLPA